MECRPSYYAGLAKNASLFKIWPVGWTAFMNVGSRVGCVAAYFGFALKQGFSRAACRDIVRFEMFPGYAVVGRRATNVVASFAPKSAEGPDYFPDVSPSSFNRRSVPPASFLETIRGGLYLKLTRGAVTPETSSLALARRRFCLITKTFEKKKRGTANFGKDLNALYTEKL